MVIAAALAAVDIPLFIYSLVMVITCERVITIRIYLLLLKMLLLLVNSVTLYAIVM